MSTIIDSTYIDGQYYVLFPTDLSLGNHTVSLYSTSTNQLLSSLVVNNSGSTKTLSSNLPNTGILDSTLYITVVFVVLIGAVLIYKKFISKARKIIS